MASVSGRTLLDGEPLAFGQVIAMNDAGKTAEGEIKRDGTFVLSGSRNAGGVLPGSYQVAVVAYEEGGNATLNPEQQRKLLVPARYAQPASSGLGFNVAAGEVKEITLELTTMK